MSSHFIVSVLCFFTATFLLYKDGKMYYQLEPTFGREIPPEHQNFVAVASAADSEAVLAYVLPKLVPIRS
jgi:hypothetical protein